jgi:hypothetical protein
MDVDERKCPECGGPAEDMHFRIDETADCMACNWTGHEDLAQPKENNG